MPSDTQRLNDILDEDSESVGVSEKLHDWTFEEIIMTAQPIPRDEYTLINWNTPNAKHVSAVIRMIAKNCDVSFGLTVQAALIHGFSIFNHRYSGTIDLVSALNDAAVTNGTDDYFDLVCHRISFNGDVKRLPVRTDVATAEALGNIAAILGTSRSTLAGLCIYLSLLTSTDALPAAARPGFEKVVAKIDTHIQLYQSHASTVISRIT